MFAFTANYQTLLDGQDAALLRTVLYPACMAMTCQASHGIVSVQHGTCMLSAACKVTDRALLAGCCCLLLSNESCVVSVQGAAHLLLEAYRAAESAFLAGLGIEPTDQALIDGLKFTHKAISEADKAEGNPHKR